VAFLWSLWLWHWRLFIFTKREVFNMAQLLNIQPDDLEPIEFTHFDSWFEDEDEEEEEENASKLNLCANQILNNWEQTLGLKFARDGMDFNCWEAVQDLFSDIVDQIVLNGYSVYQGDEFIEIYSKADSINITTEEE